MQFYRDILARAEEKKCCKDVGWDLLKAIANGDEESAQKAIARDCIWLLNNGLFAPGTYDFPKAKFTINKNGKLDGLYEQFYTITVPIIYMRCNYKGGKLNGLYERFHLSGDIWETCTYKNDKIEGLFKRFYFYNNEKYCVSRNYRNGKPID